MLYPMKRVDFDPNGERNPQNRGNSGYERISWDEALDIVAERDQAAEARARPRLRSSYRQSSHHQWGNVGYYLSALLRFGNLIGFTRMAAQPRQLGRLVLGRACTTGATASASASPATTARSRTACKEAEHDRLLVERPGEHQRRATRASRARSAASGPRSSASSSSTSIRTATRPRSCSAARGSRSARAPTRRSRSRSCTSGSPRASTTRSTSPTRTTGFDEWRDYVLGDDRRRAQDAGVAGSGDRRPGARRARAGARVGHARRPTSPPAARARLRRRLPRRHRRAVGALHDHADGHAGLGKPGVNMGNLQAGTPVDLEFYFPGYAEGGISGDLQWTGTAVNNYQRMPHVLTVNPVQQMVPRQQFPEAIIEGKATGYLVGRHRRPRSSSRPSTIRCPGYSRIHMIYRYGGSFFGTMTESNRMVEAYRHESIEFVVNQSHLDGGRGAVRRRHPAGLHQLRALGHRRVGLGSGGYLPARLQRQLNHRVIVLQHKCIEPLGESKSDYEIFTRHPAAPGARRDLHRGLQRARLGASASSTPPTCRKHITWKEFVQEGLLRRARRSRRHCATPVQLPLVRRRAARRTSPEPQPLPSQYAEDFGKGLQTPSGKIEFVARDPQARRPRQSRSARRSTATSRRGRGRDTDGAGRDASRCS